VLVLVDVCNLAISFLLSASISGILEAPLLAIWLLLVFTVVADTVEVVVLEVVLTVVLARKLNGDKLVTGVVLKPENVPNALFVGVP